MNLSDNRIIVSPDQTRSIKKGRCSSPIPTDLIMEIFSRLPAKSVGRYRLLSKFWSNELSSQDFIDFYAAKSSARPQILFLRRKEISISFFSAPQPAENSSDNIATTQLTHYPLLPDYKVTVPVNGLVCLSGSLYVSIIHNPSTGEFLILPTRRIRVNLRNFLGYDPTEKRLKVLSLHFGGGKFFERGNMDSQVLTFGTKVLSWRKIECCKPHHPVGREICINGVLYYLAFGRLKEKLIVCFDVRSETFKFMKVTETFKTKLPWAATLTNYDGKLGLLIHKESNHFITGKSRSFELWILKDAEKHVWSKDVYILPPVWKKIVGENNQLRFVGMIGTNEIVLSSRYLQMYPCFFYYNIEENTIRKLNIQGMEGLTSSREVEMFLNHAEGVSVLKLLN